MNEIWTFLRELTTNSLFPALVMLAVGLAVIRVILVLAKRALNKSPLDKTAVSLIRSVLRVTLYVLLGMMVCDRLGIDVSGVLALASVATLALSLALQDILGNVIGGFTLLSNHPFKAGDYVEIAGLAGVVQSIDIAYTKLTTLDNKTVFIPNSTVVSSQIINYSATGTRRVDITVRLAYDIPVAAAKAALTEAAQVDTLLPDRPPFVGVRAYGESTMEYMVQGWTTADQYWATLFAINERITQKLAEHGLQLSYPHLNVHLDKEGEA